MVFPAKITVANAAVNSDSLLDRNERAETATGGDPPEDFWEPGQPSCIARFSVKGVITMGPYEAERVEGW